MKDSTIIDQYETTSWNSNIIMPVHQLTSQIVIKGIKTILTLDEAKKESNNKHIHIEGMQVSLSHEWPEYQKNDHWIWLLGQDKSSRYTKNESWILIPEKWLIKK